ncbi:Chorismate synthase [Fusarium sp. LHS14.1]|nr:Chorismate synthase [Fusarium sp. LHS14.1]
MAFNAFSGSRRSSACETIARVAAGAVAEKWLREAYGIEIIAFVTSVGNIKLFEAFLSFAETTTRAEVDDNLLLRDQYDSTGGTFTCVIRNGPSGLGDPCFDKLHAVLAHGMLSIPVAKAFEFGSGFLGAEKTGIPKSKLQTKTNHYSDIQGGISNGMPIFFKVGFKPPATISQDQTTARYNALGEGLLVAKGRHSPCVVPRAVPIVKGMAALVIADAVMAQHTRQMGNNVLRFAIRDEE